MRYAVRALGWATKVLWILIILFSATSVYSAFNVRMSFGEPHDYFSNGFLIVSIPLFINNTGFYDLSELNITANVMDYNGSLVGRSSTFVPLIPRNSNIKMTHNASMSLDDIISKTQIYLLNDSVFNVDSSVKLIFAHAIPFQASMNKTIPWGAPLYNFSIGDISYVYHNLTHQVVTIPLSFENHSPYFGVDGTMQFEMLNSRGETVGSETSSMDVPQHSGYSSQAELIADASKLTPSGEIHFFFETSVFSFGPVVMLYD